jgi:hypothetical protein
MGNDRYTKLVLTVIAMSLVTIAVQNLLLPAAQAERKLLRAAALNKIRVGYPTHPKTHCS